MANSITYTSGTGGLIGPDKHGITAADVLGNGMTQAQKVRENRLRRMARRQGYGLRKTRRLDVRARDYGWFYLREWTTDGDKPRRGEEIGPFKRLEELEHFLLTGERRPEA